MKCVLYSETRPRLKENAISGLDVLLANIAHGIGEKFSGMLYVNIYGEVGGELPELLKNKFNEKSLNTEKISKFKSLLPILSKVEEECIEELAHEVSDDSSVIFVVGADVRMVLRAMWLIKKAKINYQIYFIDDPIVSLTNAKFGEIRKFLWINLYKKFINEAAAVYSSTNAHAAKLHQRYGVKVVELPYPYYNIYENSEYLLDFHEDLAEQENHKNPKEILYVGSINYLYKDMLSEVYGIVVKLCNQEKKYRLRTTVPLLNIASDELVTQRLINNELHQKVRNSEHCLLVYTYNNRYRDIVEYSFPSKLFSYIPMAKSILYVGPDYSIISELADLSGGYIKHFATCGELYEYLNGRGDENINMSERKKFVTYFIEKYSVQNFKKVFQKNNIIPVL